MGKKIDALKAMGAGAATMALSPFSGLAEMEIKAQQDKDAGKKGDGAALLAEDLRRMGRRTSDDFGSGLDAVKRGAKQLVSDDDVEKKAKGGKVSSASKRADGIAQRGKTRGKII